ncbi:MAG: PTS system nitrogen regulatory IIA component [Chlamydiales bacterium]|jgi:PTS system nitrogen regulatory IIA component
MDLKIKDVADLLNVSETTIRRWVVDGKMPAYRLNHQYRFSRTEIESWVMSRKLGKEDDQAPFGEEVAFEDLTVQDRSSKGGTKQFSLYRAIHKGGIYHQVQGTTKEEVIRNTMLQVATRLDLDADVLTDLLLDRENLMPTALNNGIGVPHTRDFLLKEHFDAIVVVFPQQPIEYGALDGKPVHSLFFLFACEDKRHLHLLAKLAHLSSKPETLDLLSSRPPEKELMAYIKDWESHIHLITD